MRPRAPKAWSAGPWRRVLAITVACLGIAAGGVALADRLCPPDLSRLAPSPLVLDRHGAILRAFPTADGQWRLAADPSEVAPNYLRMLVAVEDKRFFRHRGVDPLAMARALVQLLTHGRVVSGGSTLTMQVARLLEPRPRTLRSKLIEMARALQIEARMDKPAILRAYLTLTPTGGNLQGVRAGSLAWFGHEPGGLSDAEAALLVALPQAPRATRPDIHPDRAIAARARILALAEGAGVIDAAAFAADRTAPLPSGRRPPPRLAPLLAEHLLAEHLLAEHLLAERPAPDAPRVDPAAPIRTTIDAATQAGVERTLRAALDGLPRPVNVAAMVVDWRTGEVLARAGSGAYPDAGRHGMVDMTRASRSPGSTLKPFIYGMAFDALLAHPDSLVRDAPTRFDDYAPRNFDGGFNGDVTVRHALQASLNLPAVIALRRLGPVAFATRLREAGLPLAFHDRAAAPTLPIALGGVGLRLEQLVAAYAALADGGAPKPIVERADLGAPTSAGTNAGERLMGRPAADAVVDILAGMPPPKDVAPRGGRIAYKTGTSYRFRDGWAVGFDGGRVVGVWMGRADGGTCGGCVGRAAASLLFRVFDTMVPQPLPPRVLTPLFAGPPPPALARLGPSAAPARSDAPRIAFPLDGARLLVDAGSPSVRLSVDGGHRPYRWLVDGRPIESRAFARETSWPAPSEGFSTLTVIDGDGRSDAVKVRVVAGGGG